MLTDEGKFLIGLILFMFGIFACGYFIGWSRDKLSNKIFDNYIQAMSKARYWEKNYEGLLERYNGLILAVANKSPDESRHETALRYITERENQEGRVAMSNALKESE